MKLVDEWHNLIAHGEYGMPAPQFVLAVTPLSWGFGMYVEWKSFKRHVGVQIGPFSLAVDCTGIGTWARSWPGHLRNRQVWKEGRWQP